MQINRSAAERALEEALQMNPGPWGDHSRYVALACERIAQRCPGMSRDEAYCYGLLHDIGRHAGVSSEKHLIDGYRYCMARGWEKAAQICISHAFMIQDIGTSIGRFDVTDEEYCFMKNYIEHAQYDDYDYLVQLCDALALPEGLCLLEKRFVDVALRYGISHATLPRWRRTLEIQKYFEDKMGCGIYTVLPEAAANSFC